MELITMMMTRWRRRLFSWHWTIHAVRSTTNKTTGGENVLVIFHVHRTPVARQSWQALTGLQWHAVCGCNLFFIGINNGATAFPIPSYLHTLVPSYPHTFIPSYLHTLVPSYPRTFFKPQNTCDIFMKKSGFPPPSLQPHNRHSQSLF